MICVAKQAKDIQTNRVNNIRTLIHKRTQQKKKDDNMMAYTISTHSKDKQ